MSTIGTDDLVPRQPPRPPRPPRSGNVAHGTVAAVVIIGLLVVGAIPVASAARGAHAFWPAHWDARIVPITERDQTLRGLHYLHPVPVRFLSDKAFVKVLGGHDKPSASDLTEIGRETAAFRALGFIGGKVDLRKAATTESDAGVLAFYDFDRKEIVVRGTTLDVSHRATLAHELTHVLQDQHFDLPRIERRAAKDEAQNGGSVGAVTALIEGDANHVQDEYVKALSKTDQSAYAREQRSQGADFDKKTASVPPIVSFLFGAPYELGPPTIRVLMASGGNEAVNRALTGPTPTSAVFVEAGLIDPPPPHLAAPALAAGERADGKPESFGSFELYLTLAMRLDPTRAVAAADAVVGGRARGLRKGAAYCYRATVVTRDQAGATFVSQLGRQWALSGTGRSVTHADTSVTLTACDPGTGAVAPPKSRIANAEELIAVRGELTAQIAMTLGADTARCAARYFVSQPGALSLLEATQTNVTAAQNQQLGAIALAAGARCRDNPNSGLR